jgi:hypothetical protein
MPHPLQGSQYSASFVALQFSHVQRSMPAQVYLTGFGFVNPNRVMTRYFILPSFSLCCIMLLMLTIREVADRAGLHPDTIRRLEKRGLITSKRDVNNWRRYSPEVVDRVKQLYAGKPVDDVRQK